MESTPYSPSYEERLKELQDLIDIASAFFGYVSPSGHILSLNQRACAVIGTSYAEIVGRVFWACPWWAPLPQSAARVRDAVLAAAKGIPSAFDIQYAAGGCGSEPVRWVRLTFTPRKDPSGRIYRIAISGIDIHDRKQAEEELRASNERLELAISASNVGFYEWDIVRDRITFSPQMRDDWGIENSAETTITDAFARIHADDRSRMIRLTEESLKTGAPFLAQYRVVKPAGATIWVEVRGRVFRGPDGQPIRFLGTSTDITQQKDTADSAIARMDAIFSQAPVGVALLSGPDHTTLMINERYRTITGDRDLIGKKLADALPEIVTQGFIPVFDRVYQSGERYQANEMLIQFGRKDQTNLHDFYLDFIFEPFREENGMVSGVLVVAVDVTEQVQSRNQARQSAEEFRALAEATPQMLFTAAPSGELTYLNEKWLEYTGLTIEQARKLSWLPVVHPDHLERTTETWKRSIGSGEPYEMEYPLLRKDGMYRWHLVRALPVRDSNGTITKWVGTNTDIHEQRSLLERLVTLRKSADFERRKFQAIFASASTSLAVTRGPTHIFDQANLSYLKLFDDRPLMGKPVMEALPELYGHAFPDLLDRVYCTGEPYMDREAKVHLRRSADGPVETRYFDQSYMPMTDSYGVPYGILVHAVEVTEIVLARQALQESEARLQKATQSAEKAKAAAEQANATKSVFLANMSHEIRTPLGAITGFVNLMKDEGVTAEDSQHFLSIIERNSSQLLRLVDDILDLSKVEAGMMLIERIDFSLIELLSDVSDLMEIKAADKGIKFNLTANGRIPDLINTDPTRVRQILNNVIGNGVKFTDRGSVDLEVSFQEDVLSFAVRDSGRGISKEQENLLFQPFSQADASITRTYGGTGLGLVLTRRLTEALGGSFDLVSSTVGQGSTFVARLKVSVPQQANMVELGSSKVADTDVALEGKLTGLRVLVVEDAPDIQALMSVLLQRAGATPEFADDGARGVYSAMTHDYDVVLMDIQMPVMDGITAVRTLRERGYKTPIVALTAHAMKEERERCLKVGFTCGKVCHQDRSGVWLWRRNPACQGKALLQHQRLLPACQYIGQCLAAGEA